MQPIEIPGPDTGEVQIETIYSVVSPGTELRCLAGNQEGLIFPFIPGYSLAGRVIACGKGTELKEGTLVYCGGTSRADLNLGWGGHTSHSVQPEHNVYPLPDNVNLLWGAAAHLAGIAYRGVRLGKPEPHEKVAVIGLGAIGALAARLHAMSGAHVAGADLSPFRVSVTRYAGIDAFVPEDNLEEAFKQLFTDGADLVIDATGHPEVLRQAVKVAKSKPWDDSEEQGARVVLQGSYSGDIGFQYHSAFVKEITLYIPRDIQPRDIRVVLSMMEQDKLSLDGIINDVTSPDTAPEVYAALEARLKESITVAFQWKKI